MNQRSIAPSGYLDENDLSDIMSDMRTITLRSLQRETSSVLAAVYKGEEILVTKRNRVMARILPPLEHASQPQPTDFEKRFSQPPLPTKKGLRNPAQILQYMRSDQGE